MQDENHERKSRFLLILKNDSEHLFERVSGRGEDYLRTFALKRTRVHFVEIFKNRYADLTIEDLSIFSQELIVALDKFYSEVEELCWYLNHTEDMPATADDIANKRIKNISQYFSTLKLYLDAELEN